MSVMDIKPACTALAVALLERDAQWGLPIGAFGEKKLLKDNPYRKPFIRLQAILSKLNLSDEDRYALVSQIVDRPITSTYQLRVCEVKAINAFAHLITPTTP